MKTIIIAIPAFNEEENIEECLKSVMNFHIPNNIIHEIWVWDGGSTDNTINIVQSIERRSKFVRLMKNPYKTQSHAMNLTIKQAKADWIMRLDAHSIYPKNYLIDIYETAIKTDAGNVGGIWEIQKRSNRLLDLLAFCLITHPFGVGNSHFRSGVKSGPVDTVPFGFYNTKIFKMVGYFDERLIRAQDYEFNQRLIRHGFKIWLNPRIKIKYFPKNNVIQLLKKYFLLEAPYNAYMWYLAPYTFSLRHSITSCFTLGVIFGTVLSFFSTLILKLYLAVLILYAGLNIGSSIQLARLHKKIMLVILMPITFFLFHFGHGSGVLWGLILVAIRRSPIQKLL